MHIRNHHIARVVSVVLACSSWAAQAQTAAESAAQAERDSGQMSKIRVSADEDSEGTAANGYAVRNSPPISLWEGRQLQDLPYSLNVVPSELIENLQAVSADQVYKIVPTAQLRTPLLQTGMPLVNLRGFLVTAPAHDGIPGSNAYAHGTTLEEIERVEVLTGLSGFMYGPGNVGGLVNYVSKRPTVDRFGSFTLGYAGGSNLYAHGDFGGPIDSDGRFGYRINALTQDGETFTDDLDLQRQLISGAFDWRVTDRLLVQIDGTYSELKSGRQAYWALAPGARRPSADSLDPTRLWSQNWTDLDVESQRIGANVRWDVNDAVTLRAAYQDRKDVRTYTMSINQIQANNTYNQTSYKTPDQELQGEGWNAFADFKFSTGAITHKVTTGYLATDFTRYDHRDGEVNRPTLTGQPLSAPGVALEPTWPSHGELSRWNSSTSPMQSVMIGDDVGFNEQWSALVGVTRSTIEVQQRATPTSPLLTTYDESAVTPTASLIFKPAPYITTYASYMEALEQGAVAADTFNGFVVTNAREVMEPLTSEQIEVGVKASLGAVELAAAVFQIDKALQYYDVTVPSQPTFVQDGLQVHRGVEITTSGRLFTNFTLVGGVTLLDAKVEEQRQTPALEGKVPGNVSEEFFKVYGEYDVPGLPGLTLNAGLVYNGSAWGDANNTDRLPSYTLFDVGARYATVFAERPVTLRLNVSNVTNERYWINSQFLGDPRVALFSANLRF